jgi:hypothetical protein
MADEPAERASNLELAQKLYTHHQLLFAQAAKPPGDGNPAANQFGFSGDQFDDWAVAAGYMTKRAKEATDLEHDGAMMERNRLRARLNRAARRGDGLDRAYTVEAKFARWRVVLLERYVVEQPKEIVAGIRQCLDRSDRAADQCSNFLDAQENLSDEDRLMCQMRLEMAQMFILNGAQMMEMIIMGFDSGDPTDLKRLRRRMAKVMRREVRGGTAIVRRKKRMVRPRRKPAG